MTKELPNPLVAEVMEQVDALFCCFEKNCLLTARKVRDNIESRLTELLAKQEAVAWQVLNKDDLWVSVDRHVYETTKAIDPNEVRALTPLLETKE